MKAIVLLLVLFVSSSALAKEFSNSYAKFSLPDRWTCKFIEPIWECRIKKESNPIHALIILAAKKSAAKDTMESYETILKDPNFGAFAKKNPGQGKVVYLKRTTLEGHEWVDSVHENSEVEDFLTRYLATNIDGLSILMTLSVRSELLASYENEFLGIIKTLRAGDFSKRQ